MKPLMRKRTRESMQEHGMILANSQHQRLNAPVQQQYTGGVFSDVVNQLFMKRATDVDQQRSGGGGSTDMSTIHKEHRKKLPDLINQFVPSECGGTLEANMIYWDKEHADTDPTWIEHANIDLLDPPTFDEWMKPINEVNAFCLMPGNIILSGKMLLDLVRWEPVLGASDECLKNLLFFLEVSHK